MVLQRDSGETCDQAKLDQFKVDNRVSGEDNRLDPNDALNKGLEGLT